MRINRQSRKEARTAKSNVQEAATPAAATSAAATPAQPTEAGGKEAGIEELVLHLLGRIVLIEQDGEYSALFLNAQKNPALNFPKHTPLFRASVDDVANEEGVAHAEATFADANGVVHAFWKMDGHQVHFTGLHGKKPTPDVSLDSIADLKKIYATIDPKATWIDKAHLLAEDPRKLGIAARLSLKGFDSIDSMFFEQNGALKASPLKPVLPQDREFLPSRALSKGKNLASVHKQVTHAIIRCKARVRTLTAGPGIGKPTIVMTPFGGGKPKTVEFDDTEPLQISFSNL